MFYGVLSVIYLWIRIIHSCLIFHNKEEYTNMLFDYFYCLSIQRNKIGFFFQEDLYEKKKLQLVTATLSHIFLKTH